MNRPPIDVTSATAPLAVHFAPLIPALVRATGPVSYDYQFGERLRLFSHVVLESWQTPKTLFSHTLSTLALSDDGLAGVEIGFAGADFYPLRDALAGIVVELVENGQATPQEARALAARAEVASYLNAHVPTDAYYILALSVPEAYRGRGVGARLLTDSMTRARASGHRSLQLDVLSDNPAVEFYRAKGLSILAETRSPELTRNHGFPSELRMGIALQ